MKRVFAVFALVALLVAIRGFAAPDMSTALAYGGQEVTNIRLPLKRYENGNVVAIFAAAKAKLEQNGAYKAYGGVSLVYYSESGATNGCIRTQAATFDPSTQTAVCDGFTEFDLAGTVHLEGTNVTVFTAKEKARVETNAVLTIRTNGSAVKALQSLKTK